MKKTIALMFVFAAVFALVSAENDDSLARFIVNGRLVSEMSVEELYELEDAVVSALVISFYDNSGKTSSGEVRGTYVVNTKTKKFHYPWCYSALQIVQTRAFYPDTTPSELVEMKFSPCGMCKPHMNEKN